MKLTEVDEYKIRNERGEEKVFPAPAGFRFTNEPARRVKRGEYYAFYVEHLHEFFTKGPWDSDELSIDSYYPLEKLNTRHPVCLDSIVTTVKSIYGTSDVWIPSDQEAKFGLISDLAAEGYEFVVVNNLHQTQTPIGLLADQHRYSVCTRKIKVSK